MKDQQEPVLQYKPRWGVFVALVAYAALIRVMPYALEYFFGMPTQNSFGVWPWNISPLLATCVFGGALLFSRSVSLLLPLTIMLVSDFGIWFFSGNPDNVFHPGMPWVYGCFVLAGVCGWALRNRVTLPTALLTGLSAQCAFFLITNFVMWYSSSRVEIPEGYLRYENSLTGLWTCYVNALPFARNSFVGTMLFTTLLFSPLVLAQPRAVAQRDRLAVR